MKKIASMFAITALLFATSAIAADFTPVLKPMLNQCGHSDTVLESLLKNNKSSIISKKSVLEYTNDAENRRRVTTYYLKNATAMGYPLVKIVAVTDSYNPSTTFYFTDNRFMALKKQAVEPDESEGDSVMLIFSKQDHSISCDFA